MRENKENQIIPNQSSKISQWVSGQSNEFIAQIQIIISLFFFGISFVCQKQAMTNGMQPITYNFCRYFISTLVLYALKEIFHLKIDEEESINSTKNVNPNKPQHLITEPTLLDKFYSNFSEEHQIIIFGLLLSFTNFGGSMLQQIGLVSVTAGKTGFITGMFVVFVPIVEYLFIPKYRHHLNVGVIFSVFISFSGLYLLSGCLEQEVCLGGAIGQGEITVFISMLFWVLGIIISDYGAKSVEVITMTFYEFLLTTIFTLCFALYFEFDNFLYPFTAVRENWHLIIIVGFTEALAFALSTLGQMYTPPTRATILFSMESVTCAVLAFLILGEKLTYIEIFGAVLMTVAALISSLTAPSDDVEEELEEAERIAASSEKDTADDDNGGYGTLELGSGNSVTRQHLNERSSLLQKHAK